MQARWPNHAILRSSIIYGPDPPLVAVERPLLLQFIDECLTAKVGLGAGCSVLSLFIILVVLLWQ